MKNHAALTRSAKLGTPAQEAAYTVAYYETRLRFARERCAAADAECNWIEAELGKWREKLKTYETAAAAEAGEAPEKSEQKTDEKPTP